jgi:hypothetical protein
VGFVVDKFALGRFPSEYFGFPCQSSLPQFFSTITITYHPGLVQYASSGRGTQSPTTQITKKQTTYHSHQYLGLETNTLLSEFFYCNFNTFLASLFSLRGLAIEPCFN